LLFFYRTTPIGVVKGCARKARLRPFGRLRPLTTPLRRVRSAPGNSAQMTGAKIMSQLSFPIDSSLLVRDAHGRYVLATAEQILDAARQVIDQRMRPGTPLTSPRAVREFLSAKLAGFQYEVFAVIFVDCHHRLLEYTEMFRGTLDQAPVFPREIIKEALARNAASIIVAHCHPSGSPTFSSADESLTRRLRDALELVGLKILDHVLVAGNTTTSMAELGLL